MSLPRVARALRAHVVAAADLLWPPNCPRCGQRAERVLDQFCEGCWSELRTLHPSEARWEFGEDPPMRACAAFAVDAGFLEILGASKYRHFRSVGRRLAREAAQVAAPLLPPGVLVPVPLHPERRRERGFNQTEDFAAALALETGRAVQPAVLLRRRGGRPLAGLERPRREAAVRDAFRVNRRCAVPGDQRTAVVVDDVLTTGSTARACAVALRAAGWSAVGIVAMGRAFAAREDRGATDLSRWACF